MEQMKSKSYRLNENQWPHNEGDVKSTFWTEEVEVEVLARRREKGREVDPTLALSYWQYLVIK